jgi:hypothetical protein
MYRNSGFLGETPLQIFTDTTTVGGGVYTYYVTAYNEYGESGPSNEVTFIHYCYGDLNGDNIRTVQDAVTLLSYIVGSTPLDSYRNVTADANRDGNINIMDVVYIHRMIVGLEEAPSCQ